MSARTWDEVRALALAENGAAWPCLYPLRPSPEGEREPFPYVPETSLTDARASQLARRRRDREEARAAGLAPDEVGPFLAALRVYDANTPAWQEREALERARAMRDERLRIEAEIDEKESA